MITEKEVEYKLLILENDVAVEKLFISDLKKHTKEEPFILNAMLLRESDTLLKYFDKAGEIAFKSSFAHPEQMDQLMELFSNLPSKMVYIKTDRKEEIEKHPLYEANSIKHKIIYI